MFLFFSFCKFAFIFQHFYFFNFKKIKKYFFKNLTKDIFYSFLKLKFHFFKISKILKKFIFLFVYMITKFSKILIFQNCQDFKK